MEEGHKQISLQHIAKMLEYYPFKVTSGAQLARHKGVGKSTVARIDKFLEEEGQPPSVVPEQATQEAQASHVEECKGDEQLVLQALKADTSENGLTVGLLCGQLPQVEVDKLTKIVKGLLDLGLCITTIDEHHFQAS